MKLLLLLLALAACSERAPTPAPGSGMQMDIGQLPDDWVPAAKIAVGSWRDSLDRLHARIVAVTPVRGASGGTVPYLMQLHATDAAGKVVYDTVALVSGRDLINHQAAKATPYLASIGFSRQAIDPDLLVTILVVTDSIPEQWRGATATFANNVLVLTRDRERLEVRFTEHGAFTVTRG